MLLTETGTVALRISEPFAALTDTAADPATEVIAVSSEFLSITSKVLAVVDGLVIVGLAETNRPRDPDWASNSDDNNIANIRFFIEPFLKRMIL